MEFLKGLKQALDMGLSKDEFKNIWAEEMRSRVGASATDSSQAVNQETQDTQDTVSSTRDMGVMTDPMREDGERASIRTALTEMTGQLKQMALQQGQLRDQMKVFHESNQQLRQHLLNSQQQQTKRQEALNEKFSKMENAINDLENSFVKSAQKCFEKEGVSLKEQLSLTVETHHNHTRDQLQKLRAAIVNEICERMMQDVEKIFDEKAKEIVAASLTSLKEQNVEDDEEEEESSDEYCSAENDSGDEGDNGMETKGKQSVHNMTTQVTESSVKITKSNDRVIKNISSSVTGARVTLEKKAACDNVPEKINQETSLPSKSPRKIRAWKRSTKAVLHGELNAFMADIQKLILKPLTSKDLVHQFVEGVGGLLNSERNFLSDLFQEVQTAIGSEIQARFYKMEQSIKQEIVTAVQPFPQYEVPEDCHLYRPAAELYGSQTSLVSADTDTQSFTRSRPSTPSPFAEKIPKPVVQQQLWLFEPVSSLLKEGATESLDMLSHSSGYKFRVLAEFQTLCLEFRVVSLSGENDANLTWPVDVKISLTLQHPHNQLRTFSAAKVKTVKKPLASHGGRSSSEFIHFIKWEVLDNFTDDDKLLVKLSLCVVNQK